MTRMMRTKLPGIKRQIRRISPFEHFNSAVILIAMIMCISGIAVNAAPEPQKIKNIAPTIDLSITPAKKPVDIVIMTDYTGAKLSALNTQINALKAQFSTVNVDPAFHIVSDIKNVGTQNDQLYNFRRYGHFFYKVSSYQHYLDYGIEESYAPYTIEMTTEWEEINWLLGQVPNLPVRSPKNVTFTKGSLQYREQDDDDERKWYEVTIKCTNDPPVLSNGMVEEEIYKTSTTSHYHKYVYGAIQKEWATIDSEWTMEYKVSDVSYPVYSLDTDKLNAVPLRAGSDRHLIFLSDGYVKNYGNAFGDYFSFGDMTAALSDYIKNNNFQLYGVAPEDARSITLLMDKVSRVVPLDNTTLFKMENGKTMMPKIYFENTIYVESPVNVDDIKETAVINSNSYMLLKNGTIKYYDGVDSSIKTIEGITNAVRIYGFDYDAYLYILDSNGKVFAFSIDDGLEAFNNSVAISDILRASASNNYNIYITSSGVPYVETETYNSSTKITIKHMLKRAQIKGSGSSVRDLPAIKDVEYFSSNAKRNSLHPVLVLYTTGQIQQFVSMTADSTTNGNIRTNTPYLMETIDEALLETNVKAIDSNGNSIFIFKNDGTIKMLNNNWIIDTYTNKRDDEVSYERPMLKNATINVPLSNIQKTYRTDMERYFFVDSNNNTYMYAGGWKAPNPLLGSTLKNMGNNISKIVSRVNKYNGSSSGYAYMIYNDGSVGQLTSSYSNYIADGFYKWNQSLTLTMQSINDVKDVYVFSNQEYFLKDNGKVFRKVSGQFVEHFTNSITVDETKTYLSLLDIFNQLMSGVFYPTGAYTAAFNDIYNKYSYSSTGNMYVLLGDNIKYESAYDDYENDPEHSRKWQISHDPYYFDNSMGLSAYHNPAGFTTSPPSKLDKAGKYVINLKARDNPKADNRFDNYRLWSLGNQNLTVYIHRKPIALMRATITNNGNGTFTVKDFDAGSYDLDHNNSMADKGIKAREWRWRESTSTTWTAGQMNKVDCSPEKSYIMQLRVKDAEGVWSDYSTITIDKKNPPVALFSLDKTLIRDTDTLKVKDQSFPQSFSAITKWHWVVKKLNVNGTVPSGNLQNSQYTTSNAGTGNLAGYDANVRTSYASNGVGTFRIYLRVKDSNGLWSDGGTDSTLPADLGKYYSMDFLVDKAPTPSFTVANSVIKTADLLKARDTSTTTGVSAVTKWHWVVKKLNANGTIPVSNLLSEISTTHNAGTGALAGFDDNVMTDYSAYGTGIYRLYLRAMNGNGMWSGGGTDTTFTLADFFYRDIVVDDPPIASFTIADNPIEPSGILKLKDTSVKTGVSEIDRWHWIVKKLNPDGSVPVESLRDSQYTNHNAGTGVLAGYESNVITDYSKNGVGTYRIYLRVRNANGMWSDGGSDSAIDLGRFFCRDLVVEESFKISNFRVVKVKDLHLEGYYYNSATGQYDDRPMGVDTMAIDRQNFGELVDGLTKGYLFEFEIDTVNFNDNKDSIIITPHFYTCDSSDRDPEERELYWENSYHEILQAGEGGHAAWALIKLEKENRIIKGANKATWRGSYLIPGTAWAVPVGTTAANAAASRINRDIIVNFEIKGFKDGVMSYDYNLKQWPAERTFDKRPYEVGDVIRYSHTKCNLDDNNVILNRP